MRSKFFIVILITIIASLSGCASREEPVFAYQTQDVANAQIKLAEAAVSASSSLNQLAALEKANMPRIKISSPPNPASIGMAGLASVDWSGPIEPLIRRIAFASHYKLNVLGRPGAIPVIVQVIVQDVPIADILRDASYQAIHRANIVIYPRRRIIELRYTNH